MFFFFLSEALFWTSKHPLQGFFPLSSDHSWIAPDGVFVGIRLIFPLFPPHETGPPIRFCPPFLWSHPSLVYQCVFLISPVFRQASCSKERFWRLDFVPPFLDFFSRVALNSPPETPIYPSQRTQSRVPLPVLPLCLVSP